MGKQQGTQHTHTSYLKFSCRNSRVNNGFYSDIANAHGALQIWPEHRYYGPKPYRPADSSYKHLTIEQALVDQVELVLDIQRSYRLSQAPVIAIGSSYSKLRSMSTAMHACSMCHFWICPFKLGNVHELFSICSYTNSTTKLNISLLSGLQNYSEAYLIPT